MTRSSPKIALTSVDLPTLGRPTIATLIVFGRSGSSEPSVVASSSWSLGFGIASERRSIIGARFRHARRKSPSARPGPAREISATVRSGASPSALFTAR
jgi:hypothetical protein